MWMGELVSSENLLGYREAKRGVDVSLAAGEVHHGRSEFKRPADDRTVDVAQPSLGRCGRLSEAGRIADLASTENVAVRLHVQNNTVGLAVAAQFAASVSDYPHTRHIPDLVLVEFDWSENPPRDEILRSSSDPTGGEVDVPRAPGLGVEIDEDVIERYHADN